MTPTKDDCRTDHGAELARTLERARRRYYRERDRVLPDRRRQNEAMADFLDAGLRLEEYLAAVNDGVEAGAWLYGLTIDGRLTLTRKDAD